MDNILVRTVDGLMANPNRFLHALGVFTNSFVYEPAYASESSQSPKSGPTKIPISREGWYYIARAYHRGGSHGLTLFPHEVRRISDDLDKKVVTALESGDIGRLRQIMFRNGGYSASAEVYPENSGYSLRVNEIVDS